MTKEELDDQKWIEKQNRWEVRKLTPVKTSEFKNSSLVEIEQVESEKGTIPCYVCGKHMKGNEIIYRAMIKDSSFTFRKGAKIISLPTEHPHQICGTCLDSRVRVDSGIYRTDSMNIPGLPVSTGNVFMEERDSSIHITSTGKRLAVELVEFLEDDDDD